MKKNICKVAIFGAVVLGCLTPRQQAYNGPLPTPMEILADTNRNGIVDINDAIAKHTWTSHSGSIYTVNFDADGGLYHPNPSSPIPANKRSDAVTFDDDGKVDFEDYYINAPAPAGGPSDVDDIATIKIKAIGLEPQFRVYLKVATEVEMRAIHIFRKRVAGTNPLTDAAIWGGGHNPTAFPTPWTDGDSEVKDIEVTRWLNPNTNTTTYEETRSPANSGYYEFGIEGLLLAGMKYYPPAGAAQTFSGYIYLTVEVRDGSGTPISGMSDTICMRVAPWLALHPERPSEQVWAQDADATTNDPFLYPRAAPAAPNDRYVGLDHSEQLMTDDDTANNSRWFQDHVEIGYTQRPQPPGVSTARMHLVFRMPYFRNAVPPPAPPVPLPQPTWPVKRLLAPNVGIFQIGVRLDGVSPDMASGDYGGNLETIVPSTAFPLGRIVMGSAPPTDSLKAFINAQEFQVSSPSGASTYSIDTNWLAVGHIDEVCAFLPNDRVIIASSRQAIELLETNIPTADRAKRVFFGKHDPSISGGLKTKVGTITTDSTTAEPDKLHTGIPLAQATGHRHIRFISGLNAGYVCEITPGDNFVTVNLDTSGNPIRRHTGTDIMDYCEYIEGSLVPNAWALTKAGEQFVLIEDVQMYAPGFWPAAITVEEVLRKTAAGADNLFVQRNRYTVQQTLDDIQQQIQTANGSATLHFTPIPVLYFGRINAGTGTYQPRTWAAFTPGATNFQYVNGRLYTPRQFGPLNGTATDFYETSIVNAVTQPVLFVDDFTYYHSNTGEVHCGSNVKHSFPAAGKEWWNFVP